MNGIQVIHFFQLVLLIAQALWPLVVLVVLPLAYLLVSRTMKNSATKTALEKLILHAQQTIPNTGDRYAFVAGRAIQSGLFSKTTSPETLRTEIESTVAFLKATIPGFNDLPPAETATAANDVAAGPSLEDVHNVVVGIQNLLQSLAPAQQPEAKPEASQAGPLNAVPVATPAPVAPAPVVTTPTPTAGWAPPVT